MSLRFKLKWNGAAVTIAEKVAAERGLMLAAEEILKRANDIVPIDESTLLKSGHAWPPSQVGWVGGRGMAAAVTYDTPYAVRQHEEMSYRHPGGKQAKYLETPVNSSGGKAVLQQLVAREIKDALGA